jgi:hypothetical protein
VADRFEIDVAILGGLSEFTVKINEKGREEIYYETNGGKKHKFEYSPSGRWLPDNLA